MTKQEVKDIITTKAAAYGFKTKEESFSAMPQIERTNESYINIRFFTETNYEKTDFELDSGRGFVPHCKGRITD